MFSMPGIWEWALILVILLFLFGANKLPGLARSMGSAITEFKEGLKKGKEETDNISEEINKNEK